MLIPHRLPTHPIALALAASLSLEISEAQAQIAPDSGQSLQQLNQRQLNPTRPAPAITLPPVLIESTQSGGATISVQRIRFTGNTVLTSEQLLAALGEINAQSYDLAGLKSQAQRVTDSYREAGYPFARAYLPEQKFSDGELEIAIIEGHYGEIDAGDVQAWFSQLRPGAVIDSPTLERATLILSDQPGIQSAPLIRRGAAPGTGDLLINANRTPTYGGDLSLDNYGNRYTGAYQASANLRYDSPFLWGDQLSARALISDERQWLGSVGYSAALGSSGLRGQIGYSHTYYELAKDFSNLNAVGTAKVTSAGLSYPLIRSQQNNLKLALLYQHKALNDQNGLAASNDDKTSDGLTLTLSFDRRDGLGGGGITYGAVSFTNGKLKLSSVLENSDISSGQDSRGSFNKWNLDLARIQATAITELSLFARLSLQMAGKNLDSSEGYTLGGANGVRAYPQGEDSGDQGTLLQLEARYQKHALAPYLFYDLGRATYNANNTRLTVPAEPNHHTLAGGGLGLRYTANKFNLDMALAWRSKGGKPVSDTKDDKPRLWLTGRYVF